MEPLVRVEGVSKFYPRVHRPGERLRAFAAVLAGKPAGEGAEVLHDVSLEVYRGQGGYSVLEEVLRKPWKPQEVTQVVKDSALRGRGGAPVAAEEQLPTRAQNRLDALAGDA